MTDTLFIRLRDANADAATDLECCVAEGGGVSAVERLPPAALAARAAGRRVVAFLPAADTLAMAVTLPPMSAAKARAALPYALEDQLAGDLESQHFAVGSRLEDGRWPVRVIARTRLQDALAVLRTSGIDPHAVVAESDALRDKPGDLMLWLDGDDAHWRAPGRQTVSLPADMLADGAASALGATAAGSLGLRVHGTPADLVRHAAALDALGGQFLQAASQALPDGALPWLAAQYDPAQAVDLLQGEFAPRRHPDAGFDAWRWPLRLAAAAVLLQICGWTMEAWRLHRAAAPVEAALLAAARPLDATLQTPEAARELLRTRMADWDRRERDPALSPLLRASATLVAGRAAVPMLQVRALQQRADGSIVGRFEAGDAATQQAARSALLAAGWTDTTVADPTAADPAAAGATAGTFSLLWSAAP
ncbi:MAG: type II secretion system protein GspL [Gammaproteobacteria bacterium]